MTKKKTQIARWFVVAAALAALTPMAARAVLVHSGDSTIQGGLCVGFDCAASEPMGFSTIKIEENNLRIAAADSSTVSGFSTTDWQIEFNSSVSGGGSYFMVRDCGSGGAAGSVASTCDGTAQFTIEGGADNESIHVDSSGNQGGNVGFGTATPAVDLHVLSGNTPTLRLEQDNSSGFTPQSWDLAGNESNFFIRDVTNGSALPFRIEPGTASNTLYIDNQERIGINTTSPSQMLHLRSTLGTGQLLVEEQALPATIRTLMDLRNSGGVRFDMTNTSVAGNKVWRFGMNNAGNSFNINPVGSTGNFTFTDTGNLTIVGTLVTGGPTCGPPSPPCDLVFAPDYPLESIEEHAAEMWSRGHLPAVGPTAKELPFNVTEKTAGILNELEKAHIYIEQLSRQLAEKSHELAAVQERLERLEAYLPEATTR